MSEEATGWRKWAYRGAKKGLAISDWAGGHANSIGAKLGTERFWPTSGDYVQELQKCERILRLFCVEGLPVEEEVSTGENKPKKKRKVYRKIPPKVIQEAKGLVIFTAMRSGIAPFSGAGGGGVVIGRLRDGSWSAPSFLSPNNLSAGLMLGIDVYNAVLILRTEAALQGFRTHHVTIGTEMAVAAGPLGYGISAETSLKNGAGAKAPIFSYVLSKGFYAGVEVTGQVFIDRFDENERVYHWPGIKAANILDGKVRRPPESVKLYQALHDAELGIAQGASLEWNTDEVTTLDLEPGETLRLPPTPEQLAVYESAGIKDEDDIRQEEAERKAVRALPPPPLHPHSRNARTRISDASVLLGKKGVRSPIMGKSASECSSPAFDAADSFSSPVPSRISSPLGSPDLSSKAPAAMEQVTASTSSMNLATEKHDGSSAVQLPLVEAHEGQIAPQLMHQDSEVSVYTTDNVGGATEPPASDASGQSKPEQDKLEGIAAEEGRTEEKVKAEEDPAVQEEVGHRTPDDHKTEEHKTAEDRTDESKSAEHGHQ